jgi:hypothetical protein
MMSDQLEIMRKHESPPCVSIVVALSDIQTQDRKAALRFIKQYTDEAIDHLSTGWPDKAASHAAALNELIDNYTAAYNPGDAGIGLYVSDGHQQLFRFSFPVQSRVCIGNTFAMRELLYQDQWGFDYLILHLEEKTVQCYRGRMNKLEQINNEHFPLQFDNEYEYTSAGDREKDKSVVIGLRQKNFYREADRRLSAYLHGQPLILTGPTKDIGYFDEVTTHKPQITASVHGNFSNVSICALEDRTWPAVRSFMEMRNLEAIRELDDKGARVVDGIREVLNAAKEGRGGKLLIEKDFNSADFTDQATGRLRTIKPEEAHTLDAVEDAMRAVIDKNGEIIFVKEGVLEDHKHIALITRY